MRTDSNYRWVATGVIVLGATVTWTDIYTMSLVLPRVMANFGLDVERGSWIVNSGLLGMTAMMPATGWLASRFGMDRLYVGCLGILALSSLGCATAVSAPMLICFRVVNGAMTGILAPAGQAIIFATHPPERRGSGLALYAFGASSTIYSVALLIGYFVEQINWRIFFYLNIPMGIVAMTVAHLILRTTRSEHRQKPDIVGSALLTVCIVTLVMALTQGQREGWTSRYILTLLTISLVTFAIFLATEVRVRNPFVDLSLFKSANYTLSAVAAITYGFGLFGANFLLPLFLQNVLKYSVFLTALVMWPTGLGSAGLVFLVGWLVDRVDVRVPLLFGLALFAMSLYKFSLLAWETSFATIAFIAIVRQCAIMFLFPSVMKASLGALPFHKIAMGSGMVNLLRQVGGVVSIAVFSTLLERREIFHKSILAQTQALAPLGPERLLSSMETVYERLGNVNPLADLKAILTLDGLTSRRSS
jgi:DHA2 family multidrug resistance protein